MSADAPWRDWYRRMVPDPSRRGRYRCERVELVPGSEEDWYARKLYHGLIWPDGGPR